MRNYLTFDNKDSRDFGVYINGQGTFRAPARSYNVLNIPGRNGDLLGFGSKLENVEITYRAFIYTNFDANIAALRSFLLSHVGYFKLTDSYHPDEYRLAYYKGPFVPDVTANNGAGSFDLVFTCKPQRFLDSGEEVVSITPGQAETKTYTGNPATFVAQVGDTITSIEIPLRPSQDLHGYANPWPAGGGVNKYDMANWPYSTPRRYWGTDVQSIVAALNSLAAGTYTITAKIKIDALTDTSGNRTYGFLCTGVSVDGRETIATPAVGTVVSVSKTFTISSAQVGTFTHCYWYAGTASSTSDTATLSEIGINVGSDDTYYPYSNICPITGLTGLSVYVSPTQDPDDSTVYIVDWSAQAGTVYHGTVDPVAGQLTVDWIYKEYNGTEAWNAIANYCSLLGQEPSKSNTDMSQKSNIFVAGGNGYAEYNKFRVQENGAIVVGNKKEDGTGWRWADAAAFKSFLASLYSAGTPFAVCYELATPVEYQLTPVQIAALLAGETFIWASNNEPVTVEVSTPIPTEIDNPTLFDAKPLLRVYGTGTLGIASSTITISSADVYTDIDCELMDCYKGSANKNAYVVFSSNDFPVLKPGKTGFTFSGITQVDITPRWFSV